jgi:flagellar protein FliS
MNYNNLRKEYLKQSVMTASPAELIVMLFESCIKNLKLAEICLNDKKDIATANGHFIKAQQIIMELVNCLDTSFEISKHLLSIYDFLLYSIREMNIKKDLARLPDILEILGSLRDTWEQIARPNCDTKVC